MALFILLYSTPIICLCKSFWFISLYIVIIFLIVWSICLRSSLVHFKNRLEFLQWGRCLCVYFFVGFPLLSPVLRGFLVHLNNSFPNFLLRSPILWWCPLPIFPSSLNFSFLQEFPIFIDLEVLHLPLFLFWCFLHWHITVFNAKFYSYILAAYAYYLCLSRQFFLKIFAKNFIPSICLSCLIISRDFIILARQSAFPEYVFEWHHCYSK